ncbi:MAG: archaellin/type IV pilin N-terminal domain-containing protein [Thermoproteus sp.]|jgi:hypothetical protein|nr:MAG: flagellar biosynthesis protein FlaG [Thermoproteus sp. CIS_19]
MRKLKGIEPIVAAVLLIVLAVVGAVLLYLWFAGYVTKATSQAEQISATERLSIEAASLTSTGTANLYIRNLGGSNVTLATAYLLKPGTVSPLCAVNASAITVYKGTSPTTTASTLYPGRDQLVVINFSGCTITSGYSYVIKIVTQQGTQFAVTVTAS